MQFLRHGFWTSAGLGRKVVLVLQPKDIDAVLEAVLHELPALVGTIFDGLFQLVPILLLHLRELLKVVGSLRVVRPSAGITQDPEVL